MKTRFEPIVGKERHAFIDFLRGFALLGILVVNLPLMNAPFAWEFSEFTIWTDTINTWASRFIKFFFTSKFYVLFSLLFGMGFYYFINKADQEQRTIIKLFRKRQLWLLLFGICHIIFLWYGDILLIYALVGFVIVWFRKKTNKTLLIWAGVFISLPILIIFLIAMFLSWLMTVPEAATEIGKAFDQAFYQIENFSAKALNVYATGSFSDIIRIRLTEYNYIFSSMFFFIPNILGIFLIGFVIARKKLLYNTVENHKILNKALLFFTPLALIGNFMLVYYGEKSSMVYIDMNDVLYFLASSIGGISMAAVYIIVLFKIHNSHFTKKIILAVTRTGRMALTNYLTQSIIATTLFFSYGFALYGQINIWQGMLITLGIYLVQVVWSYYWLKHFKFGPMEWLWRSLTYAKIQALKKL